MIAARGYLCWAGAVVLLAAAEARGQTEAERNAGRKEILQLTVDGRLAEAEVLAKQWLARVEKAYGAESLPAAIFAMEVARCHQLAGRNTWAEPLFLRALAINEAVRGKSHAETGTACGNLANLYKSMGDIERAEALYLRALAIYEQAYGKKHANTATVLSHLAMMYTKIGQYAKAEPLHKRAVAIREATGGPDHPDTAQALNNLGEMYWASGDYAAAEPLLRRSVRICESKLGKDHPGTAFHLGNLAEFCRSAGKAAEAEALFRRALAVFDAKLGPTHPLGMGARENLAALLRDAGKYDEAEPLFRKVLGFHEEVLGKNHPDTATIYDQMARLYVATRDWDRAGEFRDKNRRVAREFVARTLPHLPDHEQVQFLKVKDAPAFHAAVAYGVARAADPRDREQSAGWVLNGKAVANQVRAESVLLARDSADPRAAPLVRELADVREELSALALGRPGPARDARRAALTAREDALTKDLATVVGRTGLPPRWVELKDVRATLPMDAVLIEVVRYIPPGNGGDKRPGRYAAWVISAADVQVVDLGPADAIDAAVKAVRKEHEAAGKAILEKGEPTAEKQLKEPLAALGKLVLDPLKKHIADKPRWIVSPDAALWLVPWAILPIGDTPYAVEKHRVHYVVSGRDLFRDPLKLDRRTTAPVVVADPDFDLAAGPADPAPTHGLSKDFKLGNVRRLPGTAAEAEAILPHLEKFAGAKPVVLTDAQARTAAVSKVKSPKVLVLSTHGFFLEDGKATENPLLRCGLLFAGCNRPGGADTGVLTGLEVVGTDLRGTQLVVLSACETGLGDVRNGEGVAGLRQAFQLAGAESVVATLWQIPDVESARLMAGFFQNLGAGQPRDEALRDAQLEQIRQRRVKTGAAHPFYWAAYTLTGRP